MESEERDWVVFYSKEDLASGYNLQKAEHVLVNLNLTENSEINELLELYNIKLYLDNDVYLASWDSSKKNMLSKITEVNWKKTKPFWFSISDDNIIAYIDKINRSYLESFWRIINNFQIYKKISRNLFTTILNKFPFHIYEILSFKQTVDYYSHEIRIFLIYYDRSTELLLSKVEIKHNHKSPDYYFPSCLSLLDKEDIISKYIDRPDANLNYIRIIEHSKNSDSLKLSPKTRLKAKKKQELLNKQLFTGTPSINLSVNISLSKTQLEPFVASLEEKTTYISYSEKYFDEHTDDISLFSIFRFPFLFTNIHGIIQLFSKEREISIFEKFLLKSKNEYSTSILFKRKNFISEAQVLLLSSYLKKRGKSVEQLIMSYINDYIIPNYDITFREFQFPSKQSTFLEKVRILAPELEYLLKQYQTYIDEGQVDNELASFDSSPLRFSEIKSLVEKKYVYINNDEIKQLRHHFFSDQSTLYHVNPYEGKHTNFYNLLVYEDVPASNFKEYQMSIINYLINLKYLLIDTNGYIKINKDIFMYIVKELDEDEVITYWHYPPQARITIDEMVKDGLLRFENTLFAKPEMNYFNYYLNKKDFTNGFDLRNKYLHGTNRSSEKINETEYYIIIKLLILIVIKIEDDLELYKLVRPYIDDNIKSYM